MHKSVVLAAALAALGFACSDRVAPTNPYDPATPPEQQAKGQIRGTLLVSGAGAAVDVTVFLRKNGQLARQTTTASDGAFLLDDVVPGSYTLEVSPTGFVPLSLPMTVAPGERIDTGRMALTSAAAASVIEGTATLAGAVDSGGTLVEAVGRAYTAVTNSQGQFHLDLPEGTYDLRLSHEDYVTLTVAAVAVARGETRVLDAVSLPSNPATIAGHVDAELAGGGTGPLVDATVTLEGTALTGLTNAAGDFALGGVPPGSYVLRVLKSGYSQTAAPILDLAGGEARALPDPFTLSLLRGGLRGAVALADTADASGIVVEVAGTSRATVTGSDGVFAFDGLLTGAYALSAHKDGYTRRDLGSWTVSAGAVTAVSPAPPAVLTPLGGAVAVAEGAYVNVRGVHLTVAAGSGYYRAAERPQALPAGWTAVPAGGQIPFELSDADGEHVVDVVFSPDGVTAGTPAFATVVLDRQPPSSPAIAVGDGSGYSRAPGGIVSLALSALDLPPTAGATVSGVARMQLSNDAAFTAPETRDYALTATWTLAAPSADGPKAVYVRFLDRAGNVSAAASAAVVLDRIAPASPALALAGPPGSPAGYTSSASVEATLSATDANGPLLARLSNTPGFEGARYQAFSSSSWAAWTLPPGEGQKTVYAQFMDPAGNESLAVPATILLDAAAPANPVVAITERDSLPTNGFTAVRTVDLALSASGNPTAAQVSEDPSFATGVTVVSLAGLVQPVAAPFTLAGSGPRTVYARFEDLAGNWSPAASARVTVDDTAPALPALAVRATLADGTPSATLAASTVVVLDVSGTGDAVEMTSAQGAACGAPWSGSWFPVAGSAVMVLDPPEGVKTVCLRTRDAAGNESPIASRTVELDLTPPTNPAFRDLSTTITRAPTVTGTLVAASTDLPHAADSVTYQCLSTLAGAWGPCAGTAPSFSFELVRNASNVVGVRARDAAGNVSAGTLVSVVQDDTPPTPPSLTDLETTADSLTAFWEPGADTDVDHYLVYYGIAPGDFSGRGAAQGDSPVAVAAQGGGQSLRLTGLDAGRLYYVAVEAVDRAGNGSGPSGQRAAEPNRVNPRVIANFGAKAKALASRVEDGRVLLFLATNQGVLQLDASSDASAPVVVARATVPNIVPDAPPAVLPCSRGGVAGHCVVLAGTTLEGDWSGQSDAIRAPSPVVFLPAGGTAQRPAIGTLLATLPVRPFRVVGGAVGGQAMVLAVEGTRVTAFDLASPASPRTLAAVPVPYALASVGAAALQGTSLLTYGPVADPASGGPARVQEVAIAVTAAGTALSAQDRGLLLDRGGAPLAPTLVSFEGGPYAVVMESTGETENVFVCRYALGTAAPRYCALLANFRSGAPTQLTSLGGQVALLVRQGTLRFTLSRALDSGAGLTVVAGTATTAVGTGRAALLADHGAVPGSAGVHLVALMDVDANGSGRLARWALTDDGVTEAASFEDARVEAFAEWDGFVFVARDSQIDTIDLANPLSPVVTSMVQPGASFQHLLVQGGTLYAVDYTSRQIEVFRCDPSGALSPVGAVPTPLVPNDLAIAGRYLFAGFFDRVMAWDTTDLSRPPVSLATGAIYGLDARSGSGSLGYLATVYGVDLSGHLQTLGFDGTAFAPLGGLQLSGTRNDVAVTGPYALVFGLTGTDLVNVSNPASPYVSWPGLPVATSMLQGGYVTGVTILGDPGGPEFVAYEAGSLDGTSPYSGCSMRSTADQMGVHRDGAYLLSCGDNGLTLFGVADARHARLLAREAVSSQWFGTGAPLASDGFASYFAGPQPTDLAQPAYLYLAPDEQNPSGQPAHPYPAVGMAPSRSAQWLLEREGIVWAFEYDRSTSVSSMVAYDAASGLWATVGSAELTSIGRGFSVQPVTDGARIYLAGGGSDQVTAYDARTPWAPGAAGETSRVLGSPGHTIDALAVHRERLYAGTTITGGVPVIAVLDTRDLGASALADVRLGAPADSFVTGITVAGPWLFYTYRSAAPTGPSGLGVVRLGANGDGAGAVELGRLGSADRLANPTVSGDTLFVSSNQAVAAFDLEPLWRSSQLPTLRASPPSQEAVYTGDVRMIVNGPFAYLLGGGYRVFDLR
jgi:hypothetical protein